MPTYTLTASQLYGQGILNSFSIPSGTSFDSDYQVILDKAVSLGYTLPSSNTQTLQNTLLTSLKTDGVWDKLDIFYVFAVDNNASEFATINWKNPNALLNTPTQSTLINAPEFVNNGGFQGNGTSSYIDTNFNPATQGVQYTQNNASRYFFVHAISTTAGRFDGNSNTNRNTMVRGLTNAQRINAGTNTASIALDFVNAVTTKAIHRTSATDITAFNGLTGISATQTSATMDSTNQLILKAGSQNGGHTCAAYAMGASLISENTDFVNAFDTYKSSL
jgi:hypothetical protein